VLNTSGWQTLKRSGEALDLCSEVAGSNFYLTIETEFARLAIL